MGDCEWTLQQGDFWSDILRKLFMLRMVIAWKWLPCWSLESLTLWILKTGQGWMKTDLTLQLAFLWGEVGVDNIQWSLVTLLVVCFYENANLLYDFKRKQTSSSLPLPFSRQVNKGISPVFEQAQVVKWGLELILTSKMLLFIQAWQGGTSDLLHSFV